MRTFLKIFGILLLSGVVIFAFLNNKKNINTPNDVVIENNSKSEENITTRDGKEDESTPGTIVVKNPITQKPTNDTNQDEPVFCTMDAKMCPDGTYVGRTGPKCEFQACPASTTTGIVYNALLEQTTTVSGVYITPLKIKEDSRCKEGVQCIWAGRLIVTTELENSILESEVLKKQFDMEIGKPVVFSGKQVTLQGADENGGMFSFEVK